MKEDDIKQELDEDDCGLKAEIDTVNEMLTVCITEFEEGIITENEDFK